MEREFVFRNGMEVFGSDGGKIGKIVEVDPNYIVVEKGFFFPSDHFIPTSAVSSVGEDDKVYLNVTKDAALEQGWETPPPAMVEGTDSTAPMMPDGGLGTATGPGPVAAGYDTTSDAAMDEFATGRAGQDLSGSTMPGARTDTTETTSYAGDPAYRDRLAPEDTGMAQDSATIRRPMETTEADQVRVPVYEEEVTPVKRAAERGKVRIEKDVVEEVRQVDVPVREERVRVSRVGADPNAPVDDTTAFEEGTIEVPLHGEDVTLEKRARQTGEVRVEKEGVERTEHLGDTVRREEVRVDDRTVDASAPDRADRAKDKAKGIVDRARDAMTDTGRDLPPS